MQSSRLWITVASTVLVVATAGSRANADQPLVAPEWAPQYTLTTPEMKRGGLIPTLRYLSFSFRRIRSGRGGSVQLKARGPSGPIDVSGVAFSFNQDSGEISLSPRMGMGFMMHESSPDIEFYLITPASMAGEHLGEFLISNSGQYWQSRGVAHIGTPMG